MRHTALGEAYAHDAQEVIQILIQEAGCEPEDCCHLKVQENAALISKAKKFRAAVMEDSSEEYVLYVEADSEEEVEDILQEAGIRAGGGEE